MSHLTSLFDKVKGFGPDWRLVIEFLKNNRYKMSLEHFDQETKKLTIENHVFGDEVMTTLRRGLFNDLFDIIESQHNNILKQLT